MSKRPLPQLPAIQARAGLDFEPTANALQRWNPAIRAQSDGSDPRPVISIFGYIGDAWSETPATEAYVQSALRAAGDQDVIVNINSPGGSYFVGLAIFNLLRMHKGKVTTRVIGQAASAASVVAMGGDSLEIGRAAFLMIHNALVCACGNRHELRAVAEMLEPFDEAMAELYAARTGKSVEEMVTMMDKETWIGGDAAVEQGFADNLLAADQIQQEEGQESPSAFARMKIQAALTKAGHSRGSARALLKEFSGTLNAAATAMPGAGAPAPNIKPSAGGPEPQAHPKPNAQGVRMDLNTLKAEHPELYTQVLNEGRENGHKEGAAAERARIAAIDAAAVVGHEALTTKAKAEGLSAGDYALQVMAAEKQAREAAAAALAADAPKPASQQAPADTVATIKRAEFNALSVAEQQAKVKAGVKIVD